MGPGSFSQYNDLSLATEVRSALQRSPRVNAGTLQVTAYRGIVELSGMVDSETQREAAVQTARKVEGVKSVKDSLRVR